jgi:MinD superfamily P-loop ATPase
MADPKQLVILSGKGGTGKTSVAAALAHLAALASNLHLVMADADVDASNLDLVLQAERCETHDFASGFLAHINESQCIACGQCVEGCYFEAILQLDHEVPYSIDPLACEGCAACVYRCPVGAIEMVEPVVGQWFRSKTPYGPLYHAHLFAGAENSGRLVTLVKQQARLRALDDDSPLLLVDGPPGIGCPVISASAGAHLALLVVEPTPAGLHDLDRILQTTQHFGIPAMVVVNKADLSVTRTQEIEGYCQRQAIPLAAHLPYDTAVTEAMIRGRPITAYRAAGAVSHALRKVWRRVKRHLEID